MFQLTREHFEEAAKQPNAFAMVQWAWEAEATVREMRAWGRADRGEPPEVIAKPKRTMLFE